MTGLNDFFSKYGVKCTILVDSLSGGSHVNAHEIHITLSLSVFLEVFLRPFEIFVFLHLRIVKGVAETFLVKDLNIVTGFFIPLHFLKI